MKRSLAVLLALLLAMNASSAVLAEEGTAEELISGQDTFLSEEAAVLLSDSIVEDDGGIVVENPDDSGDGEVTEIRVSDFGGLKAAQDVNIRIKKNQIYGLIGPNGAGKTTMLSIMSNQNPSSSGMVALDGDNIWENRKALDRICFSRELNITAESGLAAYTVKRYLGAAALYLPHWDKEMAAHLMQTF